MKETTTPGSSGVFRRPASSCAGLVETLPAMLSAVARHAGSASTAAAIANGLVEVVGGRCAAVYFAEPDEHTLRLAAACNAPEAPTQAMVFDVQNRDPAVRAARTRLLYLASDEHDAELTSFAVPLLSGDRLLGAVTCELAARLDGRDFATLDALGVVLGALVDRARRADEARVRAEWTSLVAHELRQPLSILAMQASSVMAALDALGDGVVPSTVRRMLGTVARLNRLVGDLTDAALVDLSKISLRRAPTDLVGLAEQLTDRTHPETARRIRLHVRGEIPQVSLDAGRVEQIVSNLLSNAEKYGLAGSEIQLSIERRRTGVRVSVTSEGPVIPADEQARLFDRFYRAHDGGADGLGMGLHVCRGLVEAHGGTISVTSAGGSTTFCVTFPIPTARPAVASGPAPRAGVLARIQTRGNGR